MISPKRIVKFCKYFLPVAIVSTTLCGLVYIVMQQNYRQSANDPQIQMAEDDAAQLANVPNFKQVTFGTHIDIAKSLAPYLMFFDENGNLIASQAMLDGKPPVVPTGIFDAVKKGGEKRFTWQPKDDVRSAVVVTYFNQQNAGFVLAGRSLREVENRVRQLAVQVGFVWIFTLATEFVFAFLFAFI